MPLAFQRVFFDLLCYAQVEFCNIFVVQHNIHFLQKILQNMKLFVVEVLET